MMDGDGQTNSGQFAATTEGTQEVTANDIETAVTTDSEHSGNASATIHTPSEDVEFKPMPAWLEELKSIPALIDSQSDYLPGDEEILELPRQASINEEGVESETHDAGIQAAKSELIREAIAERTRLIAERTTTTIAEVENYFDTMQPRNYSFRISRRRFDALSALDRGFVEQNFDTEVGWPYAHLKIKPTRKAAIRNRSKAWVIDIATYLAQFDDAGNRNRTIFVYPEGYTGARPNFHGFDVTEDIWADVYYETVYDLWIWPEVYEIKDRYAKYVAALTDKSSYQFLETGWWFQDDTRKKHQLLQALTTMDQMFDSWMFDANPTVPEGSDLEAPEVGLAPLIGTKTSPTLGLMTEIMKSGGISYAVPEDREASSAHMMEGANQSDSLYTLGSPLGEDASLGDAEFVSPPLTAGATEDDNLALFFENDEGLHAAIVKIKNFAEFRNGFSRSADLGFSKYGYSVSDFYDDWWERWGEATHLTLDVLGMIPVIGFAFDLVNAGLYMAEGKLMMAGLSTVAAIPGIGQAATAIKLAARAKGAMSAFKMTRMVSGGMKQVAALSARTVKTLYAMGEVGYALYAKVLKAAENKSIQILRAAGVKSPIAAKVIRQAVCFFLGNPVDPVNGVPVYIGTDIVLAGTINFDFKREYRGKKYAGSKFGEEWSSALDMFLDLQDGMIRFVSKDSEEIFFHIPENEGELSHNIGGPYYKLVRIAGKFCVRDAIGRFYEFGREDEGRFELSAVFDQYTNRIDFDYSDPSSLILSHSDGHSARVSLSGDRYNSVEILDEKGSIKRRVDYAYDQLGRLSRVEWDGQDFEEYHYHQNGLLDGRKYSNGFWCRYHFDFDNRVSRVETNSGFLNDTFEYAFDNLDEENWPLVPADILREATQVTSYTNQEGQKRHIFIKGIVAIAELEDDGALTRSVYNGEQQLIELIDPEGHSTKFGYGMWGQLEKVTDPLGNTELALHDASGGLYKTIDALGRETHLILDRYGKPVEVRGPEDLRLNLRYNEKGLVIEVREGELFDPETGKELPLGSGVALKSEDDTRPVVFRRYDRHNRLQEIIDFEGKARRFQFDCVGNLHREIFPDGNLNAYSYDSANRLIEEKLCDGTTNKYEYDKRGNRTAIIDGLGNKTSFTFGGYDVLLMSKNPKGEEIHFDYDGALRLTKVTNEYGENATFEYGPGGTVSRFTDFSGEWVDYRYNLNGQSLGGTTNTGLRTSLVRDALGTIIEQHCHDGSWDDEQQQYKPRIKRFGYDAVGNLVSVENESGKIDVRYDQLDRPVKSMWDKYVAEIQHSPLGVTSFKVIGLNGDYETQMNRDQMGRIDKFTVNQSTGFARQFDKRDRESARRFFSPDQVPSFLANQISGEGRLLSHHLFTGDNAGEMAKAFLAGDNSISPQVNMSRSYNYDRRGILESTRCRKAGDTRYSVNSLGLINEVNNQDTSSVTIERFGYDAASNIQSSRRATGGPSPEAIERLLNQPRPGNEIEWTRGAGGRPETTSESHLPKVLYEYDDWGRVVMRTNGSSDTRQLYTWNGDDQLTSVKSIDSHGMASLWRYEYDALDRRVLKECVFDRGRANKQERESEKLVEPYGCRFVWHDLRLLAEDYYGNWADKRQQLGQVQWHYLPQDPFVPQARVQGDTTLFVITDHLGTPRELVNASGDIKWHASLTLWGELKSGSDAAFQWHMPMRFVGQYWDAETGLHYNHNRYYDPRTGSYLSRDPLGLAGSLRAHGYVLNATLMVDPLGLQYFIYHILDAAGNVCYVGRTKNMAATQRRHQRTGRATGPGAARPYNIVQVDTASTRNQAIGMEQAHIEYYATNNSVRGDRASSSHYPGEGNRRNEMSRDQQNGHSDTARNQNDRNSRRSSRSNELRNLRRSGGFGCGLARTTCNAVNHIPREFTSLVR